MTPSDLDYAEGLRQQIAKLTEENAQLRVLLGASLQDTERLDWLEKRNPYLWANSHAGETWRGKIDQARKETP